MGDIQEVYGFPFPMPNAIDFVNYSNEDIGFNANLVAGVNDVEQFAVPYPATLDLFAQTISVHAIEFILHNDRKIRGGVTFFSYLVHLSMLDREFSVSWFGNLDDGNDEAWKAQFAGPMHVGTMGGAITASASVEGSHREISHQDVLYYPPVPLDLITPLFVQYTNQTATINTTTNAVVEADFSAFERSTLRMWFVTRFLSAEERATRNTSIRFQRLDS